MRLDYIEAFFPSSFPSSPPPLVLAILSLLLEGMRFFVVVSTTLCKISSKGGGDVCMDGRRA